MLLRVAEKVVEPETGRVVPPACRSMVGLMGVIVRPFLVNHSLMRNLEAPVGKTCEPSCLLFCTDLFYHRKQGTCTHIYLQNHRINIDERRVSADRHETHTLC